MESFTKEEILSVGIDIGTSTTQLVFSRIVLKNLAPAFNIARIAIVGKTIVYRSEIYLTPLTSDDRIDMDAVMQIIDSEYHQAGIDKTDIDIGAVIITGETARRANAQEALGKLSGYAGDFVVATAGPELESIIAGKGAGADKYSKDHKATVANIDIGGGTSNVAIFDRGDVIAAGCLDIGGRQLTFAPDGTITYINDKIAHIIEQEGLPIHRGGRAEAGKLKALARIMVHQLEALVGIAERDPYFEQLITINDMLPSKAVSHVMFSGGVGDIYYRESRGDNDVFRYQDLGILMADALRESSFSQKLIVVEPEETIRATVVGAGSHTANISGTTVTYDRRALPLKNIPIIRIPDAIAPDDPLFVEELGKRIEWFELEGENQQLAIAFKGINAPDFRQLEVIARQLLQGMEQVISSGRTLIILVEHDMAKALGHTIKRLLTTDNPVVCIDCVEVGEGDYIDIGNPIIGGMVLPVIVKTLIFK